MHRIVVLQMISSQYVWLVYVAFVALSYQRRSFWQTVRDDDIEGGYHGGGGRSAQSLT